MTLRDTFATLDRYIIASNMNAEMVSFLDSPATQAMFHSFQSDEQHTHTERLAFHHYNERIMSDLSGITLHPYIGCSRFMCTLCDEFRAEPGIFDSRGCDDTLDHQWNFHRMFDSEGAKEGFRSALKSVFQYL